MELIPEVRNFIVLLITFGTIILTLKLCASWILRVDKFVELLKEKNRLLKEISDTLKQLKK